MAHGMYVGVNNVARKVRNIYVGVNNIARKVRKGFIGILNTARLFFSGGLRFEKNATPLSIAKAYPLGATIGDYAVFAGGSGGSSYYTSVDCYDSNGTKTTATAASDGRDGRNMESVSTPDYCFFIGNANTTSTKSNIDVYSPDLTLTSIDRTAIYNKSKWCAMASSNFNGNVVIGGGMTFEQPRNIDTPDSYINDLYGGNHTLHIINNSLTISSTTQSLYSILCGCKMGAIGSYLVCAGGAKFYSYGTSKSMRCLTSCDDVYAYDNSFTKYSLTSFRKPKDSMLCLNLGHYLIFSGGYSHYYKFDDSSYYDVYTSDAYDAQLTRISLADIPLDPQFQSSSDGTLAFFMGGANSGIYTYDENLVLTQAAETSDGRYAAGSAPVGDKFIFAGGMLNDSTSATVDIFTVE